MTLHEIVLLYDSMPGEDVDKIMNTCDSLDVDLKIIKPEEYRVPIGFLSYGTEDQIREYLVDPESLGAFERPMLVLAGFTNQRIKAFLDEMKRRDIPPIPLKAILTEYNAVWDSCSLYEELKKEDEYMRNNSSSS